MDNTALPKKQEIINPIRGKIKALESMYEIIYNGKGKIEQFINLETKVVTKKATEITSQIIINYLEEQKKKELGEKEKEYRNNWSEELKDEIDRSNEHRLRTIETLLINTKQKAYQVGIYPSGKPYLGAEAELDHICVYRKVTQEFLRDKGLIEDRSSTWDWRDERLFIDRGLEMGYVNEYQPSIYEQIKRGYLLEKGERKEITAQEIFDNWDKESKRRLIPTGTDFENLPEIFQKFFNHLFPEQKDREYVIKWLANSLFDMNLSVLCLVGAGGIGKGTLVSIWSHLLGIHNFSEVTNQTMEGEFGLSKFKRKRGVHWDEARLNSRNFDIFKTTTNNVFTANQKHKDEMDLEKSHSMIISSNRLDSLKLNEGELNRRLSVVGLSTNRLENSLSKQEINQLNSLRTRAEYDCECHQLYSYLYYIFMDGIKEKDNVATEQYVNEEMFEELREASIPTYLDNFDEFFRDFIKSECNQVREVSNKSSYTKKEEYRKEWIQQVSFSSFDKWFRDKISANRLSIKLPNKQSLKQSLSLIKKIGLNKSTKDDNQVNIYFNPNDFENQKDTGLVTEIEGEPENINRGFVDKYKGATSEYYQTNRSEYQRAEAPSPRKYIDKSLGKQKADVVSEVQKPWSLAEMKNKEGEETQPVPEEEDTTNEEIDIPF